MVDDVLIKFEADITYNGEKITERLTSKMKPRARFPDMPDAAFFITGEFVPVKEIEYGEQQSCMLHLVTDPSNLPRFKLGGEFDLYGSPTRKIGKGEITKIISTSSV